MRPVSIYIGEAIEKMLLEKRISTKINYEVLKNLNNIGGMSSSATAAAASVEDGPKVEDKPKVDITAAAAAATSTRYIDLF